MLQRILEFKKKDLEERKERIPLSVLRKQAERLPTRSFKKSLKKNGLAVIAELKKASPSKGLIRKNFFLPFLIEELETAGADAFSILTEERFFQGKLDYLKQAKEISSLPILRKDFIFDSYQVFESKAYGADAVLLICQVLNFKELRELFNLARGIGLEVLFEVSSREEIEFALDLGAEMVGINNRNLNTFEVSLEHSLNLVSLLPAKICRVAESGVKGGEDAFRLKEAGFDAVLVGEALMRASDLKSKLKELKN